MKVEVERFGSAEYFNLFKITNAIIYCPNCHAQHVDAPEPETCRCGCSLSRHRDGEDATRCQSFACPCMRFVMAWRNPPHVRHFCHTCKQVFDFATNPTYGVKSLENTSQGGV